MKTLSRVEGFKNEGSASCVDARRQRFSKTITSLEGKTINLAGYLDGQKRCIKATEDKKLFIRLQERSFSKTH